MIRNSLAAVVVSLVLSCRMGFCQEAAAQAPVDLNEPVTAEAVDKKVQDLATVVSQLGARMSAGDAMPYFQSGIVPAEAFMPPPADPGNLFFNETSLADVNLGAGSRVGGTNLIFRAALTGNVQGWYDTGIMSSGATSNPGQIKMGGDDIPGAGVFNMAEFAGQLKFDLNIPVFTDEQAQAYLETSYTDGQLGIRHAYGRYSFPNINVLAGAYWTAWGDEGTLPKSFNSINSTPAGANTQAKVPQLRFAIPSPNGWVTTLAIQQPLSNGNVAIDPGDVRLQRYPDLAARVRYFDGDFNSFSVGSLVHVLGREDGALNEDFVTGWGISAAGRVRVGPCGALMGGVIGGEGIQGSLFGLNTAGDMDNPPAFAAGTSVNGDLEALRTIGTYLGYQHQWSEHMLSTIAYGFAQSERARGQLLRTQTVQNAWMNLLYRANDNFAYGLQYEFGERELVNGDRGDNHRITFVVSITAGQTAKTSGNQAADALPPTLGDAVRDSVRQSVPNESGVSRFSRL